MKEIRFFFFFRLMRNAYSIKFCSVPQWLWLFYKSPLKLGCLKCAHFLYTVYCAMQCAQCTVHICVVIFVLPFSFAGWLCFEWTSSDTVFVMPMKMKKKKKKFIWNPIDKEKKRKRNKIELRCKIYFTFMTWTVNCMQNNNKKKKAIKQLHRSSFIFFWNSGFMWT